jgi:hypothetical protein
MLLVLDGGKKMLFGAEASADTFCGRETWGIGCGVGFEVTPKVLCEGCETLRRRACG